MKKILVVDANTMKMAEISRICKEKKLETISFFEIDSAVKYLKTHRREVSGIILNLSLPIFNTSGGHVWNEFHGMEMIEELTKKKIEIPILINSKTVIDLPEIMKKHNNVKGQTSFIQKQKHREDIESFINTL